MDIARTQEDIEAFFNMLRKYYAAKIHRYLPDLRFFLSMPILTKYSLFTFLFRHAQDLSASLSGRPCRMERHDLLPPARLQTFRVHRSRASFQEIYLPRLHPPFRRQAIKHPPLVPHPLEMAQPAAYSFLYLIRIRIRGNYALLRLAPIKNALSFISQRT